jgi:hypothetical protein
LRSAAALPAVHASSWRHAVGHLYHQQQQQQEVRVGAVGSEGWGREALQEQHQVGVVGRGVQGREALQQQQQVGVGAAGSEARGLEALQQCGKREVLLVRGLSCRG